MTMQVSGIFDDLNLFERNKIPKEVKYLGIAMYFQTSFPRKTAKVLSEMHPVSKAAVWRWIKKVEVKLPNPIEKKQRELMLIDENIVKGNDLNY